MSLDNYKINPTPSAFQLYYDVFLQNSLRGDEFAIKLIDGNTYNGVPTDSSFVNPVDQNVCFTFKADGNVYKIPFNDIVEVTKK